MPLKTPTCILNSTGTGWEFYRGKELLFWALREEDAVANAEAIAGVGWAPRISDPGEMLKGDS